MSPNQLEPSIRAFASLSNGVHAVAREQATESVRAQLEKRVPAEEAPLVWIDVVNPGDAEAAYLRDELGLHPLAVEDCVRGRQRPKLDRYPSYFFLVIYAAVVNPERRRMALNELHVFIGGRFMITVHDHRVDEIGEVVARWRAAPRRLGEVGALAHLLLDAIVDDYFPVLEHFADKVERLEHVVFAGSAPEDVSRISMLRHELVMFRKVVAPQREVISNLLRRDLPFLKPDLVPYFQDVHDHTIRVTEEIDSIRELLSALLDAQMSFSTNQLNQTVRMMTAWSIILMSMTLVAGIYGMNFLVMPELKWRWGYAFALSLMTGAGAILVMYFRRKRWL
jgi:magnesium transporter